MNMKNHSQHHKDSVGPSIDPPQSYYNSDTDDTPVCVTPDCNNDAMPGGEYCLSCQWALDQDKKDEEAAD